MQKHFRTPCRPIIFSETAPADKIQLFRAGTFHHPEYGKFDITPQVLAEFKKNFDNRARGIDLAIDYKHASEDVAAGWIKDLTLSQDGQELWASVDWTPNGKKVLQEKEFRYISPEFTFQYQDNETLQKHGPTLLGAGLTNRPVIKKMEPIVELAEGAPSEREKLQAELDARSKKYGIEVAPDAHLTPPSGGPQSESDFGDPVNYKYPLNDKAQIANARVRFKQFANETYKQDSSKNIIHERIVRAELAAGINPSFDPKDKLDSSLPSDIKSKLSKNEQGDKKMALGNPSDQKPAAPAAPAASCAPGQKNMADMTPEEMMAMIADLQAKLKELQDQHAQMAAEKKMAEQKSKFNVLLAEGKVCAAQEDAYLKGDMVKFVELQQPLNLAEKGSPAVKKDEGKPKDVEEEIIALAEAEMKNSKLSLSEAYQKVLREKPELTKLKYGSRGN